MFLIFVSVPRPKIYRLEFIRLIFVDGEKDGGREKNVRKKVYKKENKPTKQYRRTSNQSDTKQYRNQSPRRYSKPNVFQNDRKRPFSSGANFLIRQPLPGGCPGDSPVYIHVGFPGVLDAQPGGFQGN